MFASVHASVGESFVRIALRDGPSQLGERVKEKARRKGGVCLIS